MPCRPAFQGRRRRRPQGRHGRRRRHDRHRSPSARLVYLGVCRKPVRLVPGIAVPVHAFPQDTRLRESAARWHLAARAVSAQWIGADAARIARRAGAAAEDVLSWQRRLRSAGRRLRLESERSRRAIVFRIRHDVARERQRRPCLRDDALRRGQTGDRRVPEDVLKEQVTFVGDRVAVLKNSRLLAVAGVLLISLIGGIFVYNHFYRAETPFFAADEDHFLFGSIGTEENEGIPFWIWLVLPRIFPEYLPAPGGYASLGVLAKDGHEMPVGFSKVRRGFERVGANCALCHTASYRLRPDDPPTIVPAAAAHQFAPQQYARFLFAAASDPRFTATTILAEISKNYRLPLSDRLLFRLVVIPSTRRAILRLKDQDSWMNSRPEWGRGRTDLLNAIKFGPLAQAIDHTNGSADAPPLWNLNAHARYPFLWDGSNPNLQEVVLSSAIAAGADTAWVERDFGKWNDADPQTASSLRRVQNYIGSVQAPKYPLPIERQLAATGASVFQGNCASCHAAGGARTGTVIPVNEVGTDSQRVATWTAATVAAANA